MISSCTSGTVRASARSTPWTARYLAMSRRLVSWVRPDRISSPMISTAAVTRACSPLAIGPSLAYIDAVPAPGLKPSMPRLQPLLAAVVTTWGLAGAPAEARTPLQGARQAFEAELGRQCPAQHLENMTAGDLEGLM